MKTRILKTISQFLITVFAATLLSIGIFLFTKGMDLAGVPHADDVQKITISYPGAANEPKTISDKGQMELAVKLTGFLRYSLFEKADANGTPLITITYFLNNGQSISVSANRDTVWWKGKAYVIKDKELFINLTEGIFFPEGLDAK